MARKYNVVAYLDVCTELDDLFKEHGEDAAMCIRRYMRIRTETRATEQRIAELESELKNLKKVDSIERKRA